VLGGDENGASSPPEGESGSEIRMGEVGVDECWLQALCAALQCSDRSSKSVIGT
jgi:hypothetical protein